VDLFGREVRRAGTNINPTCTGTASTSITWASAWTVRFKADLDGDGNTSSSSETNEDVTWWISTDNNAIWRTDNNRTSTPDTLWSGSNVGGVSALNGSQFLFYDSNGNAITAASGGSGLLSATQLTQVVRIVMQLSVATTGSAPGGSRTLTASD